MNQAKFLQLLFEEGEGTCFTAKATGVSVRPAPLSSDVFFAINAIDLSADHDPRKDWHSADKPRRADINVVSYRNFLIELDEMALEKQQEYICSRLPVSSIVFSGKKSLHAIISLEEPLPDYNTYMRYVAAIMAQVPEADSSTINPSRLSRLPGVVRPDTGKEQELLYLGNRVNNKELLSVISKDLRTEVRMEPISAESYGAQRVSTDVLAAVDSPNEMVRRLGSRNKFFFWLYNRFQELEMSREAQIRFVNKAYDSLEDQSGFQLEEAYEAARVR